MSNNNYYITEKGYKRQKCSLYLQEKVYKKLIEISEKNELSISECGQRLMVQSMGLVGWILKPHRVIILISDRKVKIFPHSFFVKYLFHRSL